MSKKQMTKHRRKLLTLKEIKEDYISMNEPKLRAFLNSTIPYLKVGNRYYYPRTEVEKLLVDTENSYEYQVDY